MAVGATMITVPPVLAFTSISFFILAAATPPSNIAIGDVNNVELQRRQAIPASMCATELLCCNSVTRADDPATAQILALLGISAQPYDVIGLTCTPIIGLGVSQDSCSAQPVCCWWGAQYGYMVAVDCTPVEIGM